MRDGSCFVTGTDTGVGKTLVACALVLAFCARGLRVAALKPVAAGARRCDGVLHNEDVDALHKVGTAGLARAEVCPYVLENALAPHIAAQLEGVQLQPVLIQRAFERARAASDVLVVEGVGGFRVPLAEGYDTADLACSFALPVVLVVGLRLGCLNHAALTAEAIAARGLALAGWVGNSIDPRMAQPEHNLETLARLLPAPCLGVLPWMASPDAHDAARRLDVLPLLDV